LCLIIQSREKSRKYARTYQKRRYSCTEAIACTIVNQKKERQRRSLVRRNRLLKSSTQNRSRRFVPAHCQDYRADIYPGRLISAVRVRTHIKLPTSKYKEHLANVDDRETSTTPSGSSLGAYCVSCTFTATKIDSQPFEGPAHQHQ
jgi:hypothetical protein